MTILRSSLQFTLALVLALALMTQPASAADRPVKVFILAGQSNMVGHGKALNGRNSDYDPKQKQSKTNPAEVPGGIGSLAWAVKTMPETYGSGGTDALVDRNSDWLVRDDVNVYVRMEVFKDKDNPGQLTKGVTRKGRHTIGFGKADSATQRWIGPEYGFGHVVGNALEQDVLIIKVATGGTSLQTDWRAPIAVAKRGGEVGYMWSHMLSTVQHVLDNLETEFPEYAGRDYEIAGFGWHQGWNDRSEKGVAEYEANLADLIKDVRGEFGKDLPFVVANTGIGGAEVVGVGLDLINAQGAVADFDKYPGHKGNVAVVDTRPMYRDKFNSPSGFGYHWNHNGIAHYQIGAGMGRAYLQLAGKAGARAAADRKVMPWEDPACETDIRATRAESRPGPDEDPQSWNLWMRHHNDRKRWCTEQGVDLLMVGDSIVFGWSRVGRPVWEEFYDDRKAVNIGSSGDRTSGNEIMFYKAQITPLMSIQPDIQYVISRPFAGGSVQNASHVKGRLDHSIIWLTRSTYFSGSAFRWRPDEVIVRTFPKTSRSPKARSWLPNSHATLAKLLGSLPSRKYLLFNCKATWWAYSGVLVQARICLPQNIRM